MNGPIFASIRIVTEGALRAHLSFVEPARGVAQISKLSVSLGIASFGEVFQALAVARGASWHCHRRADWSRRVGMSRIGNPPTCRIPFGEIPMHRDQSALQASLDPYRWQCQ